MFLQHFMLEKYHAEDRSTNGENGEEHRHTRQRTITTKHNKLALESFDLSVKHVVVDGFHT
tara:strand:- start:639 stop:821 length:183 start_codon:yes stop_codon:yes gene_type:complete